MYVSDEKKSLERNALDAFLQSNRKLKGYTIDDGERPDFVLTKNGHKIGIEHFRADTILNEYTDSESMKFDGQRKKIYEKHHTKSVITGECPLLRTRISFSIFNLRISAKTVNRFLHRQPILTAMIHLAFRV